MKSLVLWSLRRLAKLRLGLARLPGANRLYAYAYGRVAPPPDQAVTVGRHRMLVDPTDLGISRSLIVRGSYEDELSARFVALLRPGMTVIEVGAHVGYYTLLAAQSVGPSGRVIAFEPDPGNYALLTRNIALNGYENVEARQQAVSDEAGTVTIYPDRDNSGRASLASGNVLEGGEATPVDAVTLDGLGLGQADLVLVSAQGAEAKIVEGGRSLLRTVPVVILDYWWNGLTAAGADPVAFLRSLQTLGFELEVLDPPVEPADVEGVVRRSRARGGDGVHLLLTRLRD